MIKPKQPLNKGKNSIVRKPSLPIKRTSSAQSNISQHSSCMSDRIASKKNQQQTISRPSETNQSKKCMNNTFQHQKTCQFLGSNKSLKKLKNKINMSGNEIVKKSEHFLTGFQWLIILRHCFHSQNKRRPTQTIKQRSLVNYIKTKVYPDSLWNKILVLDNETKFSTTQIIGCIEKQSRERLSLDDIFSCISKNYSHTKIQSQQSQSAAETARFIENMKPNIQIKQPNGQNINSKPRFIQKNSDQIIEKNKPLKKQYSSKHIEPIHTNLNSFQIEPQLGLNISPISVIEQNNDISFSISDSQFHTQSFSRIQSQLQSHSQSISEQIDNKFESGFNGVQAFKRNLLNSQKTNEEKKLLVNFLQQEILNYSIYKNKDRKNITSLSNQNIKRSVIFGTQTSDKSELALTVTQYFHGLKLQTRKNMSKLTNQVLTRIFESKQFTEYFKNFQAIKISEYYDQLPLTIPTLGARLRILNLSYNNIRSISFLKDLHLQQLQFINLNNNRITNMSQLLNLQNLVQIHVKNNMIDHVSSDKVTAKMVKIIDLANNQIQKQQDLWALAKLTNLNMLNLAGNSILVGFKSIQLVRREVIVDHTQMYVFSGYTQYKDIAFEGKQKEKEKKNM